MEQSMSRCLEASVLHFDHERQTPPEAERLEDVTTARRPEGRPLRIDVRDHPLGPQFREPNLGPVLKELALTGPLAPSPRLAGARGRNRRAGGAHRREVTDLGLYARTDDLFAHDRVLFADTARARTGCGPCRISTNQLEHALGAVLDIWHRGREGWIARAARRSALGTMRRLDREHMLAIERIHQEFARRVALADRPSIERHRKTWPRDRGRGGRAHRGWPCGGAREPACAFGLPGS